MTCREGKSEDILVDMCFMFPLPLLYEFSLCLLFNFSFTPVHTYPDNFESSTFPFGIRLPFHTHPANSALDRVVF